jgi:hypothetical protein
MDSLSRIVLNLFVLQDVRDLALHLTADAPPPNWLRINVRIILIKFFLLTDPT